MGNSKANSFFFSVLVSVLSLQSSQAIAQPGNCTDDPQFSARDFWLGSWSVTSNINGSLAGNNIIEKQEGGCLIMERWTGASGGTGTSLNYYNPVNQTWRQLWVSAGAYSIDISGGIEDGSMVLTGNIYYFAAGSVGFRGSWTPNADGSVRQFFEQYNDETQSWDVWFDGKYERE